MPANAPTTDQRPRDPQGRFDDRSGDTSAGDMKLAYGNRPGAASKAASKFKFRKPAPAAPAPTEAPVANFSADSAAFSKAKVDLEKRVVRGVSVITSGVSAIGHDMDTDDTTLRQMCDCANARGKVKTKANHGKGVEEICGYLTNFRIEGHKLLADWHLLAKHPHTEQFLEMAETIPGECGMSASFAMPEHDSFGADGRKKARCTDLVSVDFVHRPAANPNGLFSAKPIDNPEINMSTTDDPTKKKPATIEDVLAAVQGLGERIDAVEQHIAAGSDGDEPTAEDIEALLAESDEVIADHGTTRAELEKHLAAMRGEDGSGDEGDEPPAKGKDKQLSSIEKRLARFEAKERVQRRETELAAIDKEITDLAAKIDGLTELNAKQAEDIKSKDTKIAELEAKTKAQEDTLKKYGHKVVEFSATDGAQGGRTSLGFMELVDLEVKKAAEAGKPITKAAALSAVMKSNPEAHKSYLAELGVAGGKREVTA